jgi:hypothetical protein
MSISFFAGWYINGWRLNAEIAQIHSTWNEAYANQTKITIDREREITQLNTRIEADNADKEKAINDAHTENLKLAADVERLQQSTNTGGGTMPKTNYPCKCASATPAAELPRESIDFLVELAKEADDAARYASVCHDWAVSVTKELNESK